MKDAPPAYPGVVKRLRDIGILEEPELLRETAELFVGDARAQVAALRAAAAIGDTVDVASAAHRLKGAALNLGAEAIAGLAHRLEQAAAQRELVAAPALIDAAAAEIARVAAFLDVLARASGPR